MKLRAFIIGGIVGAATVMLLRKQPVNAMVDGVSQMLKTNSGKVSQVFRQGLNFRFAGRDSSARSDGQTSEQSDASSGSGAYAQLSDMLSSDEQVKKEVNEILKQNDQPTM